MNICMLSLHSSPLGKIGTRDTGGMSVYLLEISTELARAGHTVDIHTLAPEATETRVRQLRPGVRLVDIPLALDHTPDKEQLFSHLRSVVAALSAFLEGVDYSIIHSHYWLSAAAGAELAELTGLPHCITFHTLGEIKNRACGNSLESAMRCMEERRLAALADRVIALTTREKLDLVELYNVDQHRIDVIGCGVNLERFTIVDRRQRDTHVRRGSRQRNFLYVGRFVEIKGLQLLLQAFAQIGRGDLFLRVVGGDERGSREYERISLLIEQLGIGRNVMLEGRIDHNVLREIYNDADALVVPSLHESFGLAALEALACGTPVVGTSVGGLPDLIDEDNGLLVEHATPFHLAEAMHQFCSRAEKRPYSRERIRRSVRDRGWSGKAQEIAETYGKVKNICRRSRCEIR